MSEAEKQPRVRSSCGVNNVTEYVFPLDVSSILGARFLRGIIKAVFDHFKKINDTERDSFDRSTLRFQEWNTKRLANNSFY